MNPMILPTPAPNLSLNEVDRVAAMHRLEKTPVCLVTGCFDILHIGHLELIEYAATLGVLFVGINTDAAIKQLKGESRPINTLEYRAKMLAALRYVNIVFAIDSTTVDEAIRMISPTYWVKGGDYSMDTLNPKEVQAAKDCDAKILLFHGKYDISTTKILQKA